MAKSSGVTIRVEQWMVGKGSQSAIVNKVAVRHANGQFHGATNFPMRKATSMKSARFLAQSSG